MEEYLAKAESDNLLNSAKEKEMDYFQKLDRLRHINGLVFLLDAQYMKFERYFAELSNEIELDYQEMIPIMDTIKRYNFNQQEIQNLSPTNLKLQVGDFIKAVIRATQGVNTEKFLLMENIAGIL